MDVQEYIQGLTNTLRAENKSEKYITACVDYATRLINNNLPVIYDIQHLALLIGIDKRDLCHFLFCNQEKLYNTYKIPKKAGGMREITVPSITLKYIQRWLLDNVLSSIPVSDVSNGFVPGKSIVTNAIQHVGKKCIVNMDISNFFPSIKQERVFRIFKYYGYTKELSFAMAKLCTFRSELPQGSPASPYISNIVCLKLDDRLSRLANKFDAKYTRYADDITFSGGCSIKKLVDIAPKILLDEGFVANSKKTRVLMDYQRQEVTGILVNGSSIRVPKSYKRKFQQEIYFCQKHGVSDHLKRIHSEHPFFREYMYGKAYYINMVEPLTGRALLAELDGINWEDI